MARGRNRRQRVRFDQPVKNADGAGGHNITWEEVFTERCLIERLAKFRDDTERVTAGGRAAMPLVRIHIDSHAISRTIDATMRAVDLDGGKTFEINSVQDLTGRNRELTITATESGPS